MTPLKIAQSIGNQKIVNLLLSHHAAGNLALGFGVTEKEDVESLHEEHGWWNSTARWRRKNYYITQ